MRRSLQEQREKALAQEAVAKARRQRVEAKLEMQQRKADTRRKILAGAVVMERAERDPAFKKELHAWLAEKLSRRDDRELFGLAPLLGGTMAEDASVVVTHDNRDAA